MYNYFIFLLVIIVIIIFLLKSDLFKSKESDKDIIQIKKFLKNTKQADFLSEIDETNDDTTDLLNDNTNDETDISFDDKSDISFDVKSSEEKIKKKKISNNKKLFNDFKKFIEIKNKEKMLIENKHKKEINEMHKLAAKLSKKQPNIPINFPPTSVKMTEIENNKNFDLTDTISGIIHNELNNN